jgi:hypothetical protein
MYNVLIIRPNITYRSSTIVFYNTQQHVSAMQISHHQGDGENTKRNMKYVKTILGGTFPLFCLS